MLFENMVVVQDRYPLLSMPDRRLPQHPAAAPAAAAAGIQDIDETGSLTGSTDSTDSRSRLGSSEQVASEQQQQSSGLWNSDLRVGFNRPSLAAEFRAAAHARHLWGPPLQQQQQQHAQGAGSSSSGGVLLPRVVTVLLYPEDYPPVANHYALVDMLRDLTEPYGFKVGDKVRALSRAFIWERLPVT
jgi:hypothetical protein